MPKYRLTKTFILTLAALWCVANLTPLHAGAVPEVATIRSNATAVVEQMRGMNMQMAPGGPRRSDGKIIPLEQRKENILQQFRALGKDSVPALIHALGDTDVQMRRNAELVLIRLAAAYDGAPKVDIREALPALVKATEDGDGDVRAWAAQALGAIGPDAKDAVPVLIKLLADDYEGCRNESCLALADIGPAAKDALPALRKASNDASANVRQFAQQAIKKVQGE